MTALSEYNTDEYVTTKDAEAIFEGRFSALDFNTLFRAVNVERVATFKRPGQKGRPANLYPRAVADRLVRYLGDFNPQG